jgi:hypothetical protein
MISLLLLCGLRMELEKACATHSATGATARPQVGAVSESCFANDPINRQLPFRSSKNHSRFSVSLQQE